MSVILPQFGPRSGSVNVTWAPCDAATDRSSWYPLLAEFFQYWLSIHPASGLLPGRQHFDPLDIPFVMPRMWLLDVVRGDGLLRLRYRLVGTKEVETLEREVTGEWLDDVHPRIKENPALLDRYRFMAEQGKPTYRKGFVNFSHKREHVRVENFMAPLAEDGRTVDIIAACSVSFLSDGRPT
jgi:hypothetical protein